jgi:hypothetical protein
MNSGGERQFWYVSIFHPVEERYEVAVRDRDGVSFFNEIARGWEALEALIRMLDPQKLAELRIDAKSGAPFVVEVARDPGATIDDLVKQASIEFETLGAKLGLLLANRTFGQLETVLAQWRARWPRPGATVSGIPV